MQGKKDGCKEWSVEGESRFSYRGEPLPYMPFCYQPPHDAYDEAEDTEKRL